MGRERERKSGGEIATVVLIGFTVFIITAGYSDN